MESDSSRAGVQVTVEADAWEDAIDDLDGLCRNAVIAALIAAAPAEARPVEIGVLLTDDAAVRELNRAWRGHDRPTNVLAFPAQDAAAGRPEGGPILLGDVVVALETVLREARSEGRPPAHHLQHLLVHGTLHLLGHDHEDEAAAARMERLEVAALAALGVPDPYAGEVAA
jgi:probable rRNA maturation factor